jgi:UDP-4-amino-4,6-dideoxy-N-acetyl-beta-L-altrosamine transaminase
MIPYGRHSISREDIKNIKQVLKSNWLTQGPLVEKFEKKICKFVGAKYAVATNSASSALHISCLAIGLKSNQYFWTVSNSFVASANCGLHCGAKVDFVDIDKNTWNISPELLKNKLLKIKDKKKIPKILIPVHFSGQSTEQEKIKKLSKKYNFKIIEDASHSLGGIYKGEKIGSCKWSDITVFSFHPVKTITTAEGGIAVTNDISVYKKLLKLRNNGITKNYLEYKKKIKSIWYYEQHSLGFNYRMNELEASLGITQLKRIKKFIKKRNLIAKRYMKLLKNLPLQLPTIKKYNYSTFHLFVVRLKSNLIKEYSYDKFFNKIRKSGIGINLHYLPIHLQPYFKKLGFKKNYLKNSEDYSKEAISLPIYNDLTLKDQKKVVNTLKYIILKNKKNG